MTHPSAEAIAEHLEGTLAQADDQHVRAHLRGCTDCTDRAQALLALPGLLRSAGAVSPLPEHLARRIDEAIADEARRRAGAAAPAAAVAASAGAGTGTGTGTGRTRTTAALGGDTATPVAALDVRRQRRRRVLAGGLAAAAATVVAVGLGELLSTSEQAAESAGSGSPPRAESLLQSEEPGAQQPSTGRGLSAEQAPSAATLPPAPAGLIADVAAGHDPRRPGHERRDCVAAALGSDAARSGASYAVSLPGGVGPSGSVPGVVWLRPNDAPVEAVLVACAPRPSVLDRRGLGG